MGSKFFADVDTLSIHGAAGVSYIEKKYPMLTSKP
jgi:hypothetical protein